MGLVLNRPPGDRRPEPRVLAEAVARRFPAVRASVHDHDGLHNRAVARSERPPPGVVVRIVRPSRALGVGRLTRDPARIGHAIEAGLEGGKRALAAPSDGPPSGAPA